MTLKVEELAVARGGLPVLEGVSLALSPGEVLVLRGPNGIGKTTLLRSLAGLQPWIAGTVSAPPDSIAYASHADGLKAMLSVEENLAFWAAVHGQGPEALGETMETMNLTALRRRRAADLSAGQKRRLGLARLLLTGRPIWLLDEPTVSLDAESVALFASVIRDHLAAGGMALIATHIDLGLPQARSLDLAAFRADPATSVGRDGFDEAFL